MPKNGYRIGRFSKEDQEFVKQHVDDMTIEEIGRRLNRKPEAVLKFVKLLGKAPNKEEGALCIAEHALKKRPFWKELTYQFNNDELELFIYYYTSIVAQFNNDVLPTEEMQIIELVTLQLLSDRALRERNGANLHHDRLNKEITREQAKKEPDADKLFRLGQEVASLKTASNSLGVEHKTLVDKKAALFKQLKATREQRVQRLESNKETLNGLIKRIMKDPIFYEEAGKYLEQMRLAQEEELKRLGDYHKYDDGEIDRPFLTHETVNYE